KFVPLFGTCVSYFGTCISLFGMYIPKYETKLLPQRKNFYSTVLQQFKHYVSTLLQNSNEKHKERTKKSGRNRGVATASMVL
ncbi:MAG: hypothetical protein J6R54_04025, partial [Bacteroidaceae bacterium]|nr:hypothetical protein [Bacteroidaceae bacterium]